MARVLVADDERSICEAFGLLLEAEGHTPLIASTGEGALRLVRTERPDLVFVDVRMPGMDGLAVLKEIRRSNPTLPVVVMTAYGTLDTAAEALRNEAFDYLGKPLDLGQIRQVLQRALHAPAPGSQTTSVPVGTDGGIPADAGGPERPDAGIVQAHRDARRQRPDRARARRERGRQGTGGARDTRIGRALARAFRRDQLRRHTGATHRIRALRARARRVHRREVRAHRTIRGGRTGDAVPGRNLGTAAAPAEQAAASAAGTQLRAGGQPDAGAVPRPPRVRVQP